ncbi:MAG: hypothetical protein ABSG92_03640 [Conexivisphaerales archaeon]|jgi:hypothetical protein
MASQVTLEGKTLKVYWLLLNESGLGPREVQRRLHFSSVNVAVHHLEKLAEMGLVMKDEEGKYSVIKEVDVSFMRQFVKFGRVRVPRLLFYAVFILAMSGSYLLLSPPSDLRAVVFILALTALTVGFLAYESWVVWKGIP